MQKNKYKITKQTTTSVWKISAGRSRASVGNTVTFHVGETFYSQQITGGSYVTEFNGAFYLIPIENAELVPIDNIGFLNTWNGANDIPKQQMQVIQLLLFFILLSIILFTGISIGKSNKSN